MPLSSRAAGPDGDDLALLRLLLDGVGNDDAALCLLLAFNATDDDAVVQRTEFHGARFLCARERPGSILRPEGAAGVFTKH